VICVIAFKPHEFEDVFNCLRCNMRKEAELNVTMICLQIQLRYRYMISVRNEKSTTGNYHERQLT
jgi:hypothetical protein